jgi:hypothetical protein
MPSHDESAAAAATPPPKPFALVGAFEEPGALVQACEAFRDAGYRNFDAHSPFPVHGIERAMGLRPSLVPWISLLGGVLGGLGALGLQMWSMGIEYPQNISGKPLFAYQAYVPVTFEATILLSAFGAFLGMWGLNKLPQLFHPVMRYGRFPQASDDRFLLSVELSDPEFDPVRTRDLLKATGARDIEEVLP